MPVSKQAAGGSLASMTGFGRCPGHIGPLSWVWEIRTVNAKGLDIRLRLPPGFDAIDTSVRSILSAAFTRGSCHATLTTTRERSSADIAINHDALRSLIAQLADIPLNASIRPASLDGLLGLRGMIEERNSSEDEAARAEIHRAVLSGFAETVQAVNAMRKAEGAALMVILRLRIDQIASLTHEADITPGRSVEAIKTRIASQIAHLSQTQGLDPGRLHQEAILLAVRADIREELDRLNTHVTAVKHLLDQGGAIGRKLDFLSQELARESNTLCAKSNDPALTAIGLNLKVEIEQFREQVQNVE